MIGISFLKYDDTQTILISCTIVSKIASNHEDFSPIYTPDFCFCQKQNIPYTGSKYMEKKIA